MAGALTISTLNNDTGVLATQNGMTGIAKAWVNFDGTVSTPTIRGSFNVGSITKNGTGDYTVNFTTAMPNANYSVCMTAMRNFPLADTTNPLIASPFGNATYSNTFTSSSIRMQVQYTSALIKNDDGISISVSVLSS
jgi:hypothetical protein